MKDNNPLIGQFYYGFQGELVEIIGQVSPEFMMTAIYEGLAPAVKRMVALAKIQNFVLYPDKQSAFAAISGGKPVSNGLTGGGK